MEDYRFPREISLCLSGGGARGAFHLGAISVLEERGIAIKAISGTSIGALIGASLACGKSSKEILHIFKSKEFRNIFKFRFAKTYLFSLDAEAEIIRELIDKNNFETLSIPLSIAVCDVQNETIKYVNSGENFKKIVLASCSVVPLFKAVELNNTLYADGGIIDNFPVEQLKKYDYPILGINLYPKYNLVAGSMFAWMKKIAYIMWQSHNAPKRELCDFYLCSAAIRNLRAFSFKDIDKAYELGRVEMQQFFQAVNSVDS